MAIAHAPGLHHDPMVRRVMADGTITTVAG
jgi:hypothetical protein